MTPSQERIAELRALLAQWNETGLSEQQEARLQQIVADESEAPRVYLETMFFYDHLRWFYAHKNDVKSSSRSSPLVTLFGMLNSTAEWGATTFSRGVNSPVLAALLIAGLVLTLMVIWLLPAPSPPVRSSVPSGEYAAQVTRMQDCLWAPGSNALKQGDDVPKDQPLQLTSGLLEITVSTGAQISLEGPCHFQMKSAAEGNLQRGRLLARVDAKSARGLTISTPYSQVVDFGTEFGIVVETDGMTEVHVLQGLVKVDYFKPRGKVLKGGILQRGQAQRFAVDNPVPISIPANQVAFQAMQSFSAFNPLERWQACRDRLSRDPDLVAYYPFEQDKSKPDKLVNISPVGDLLNGDIVKAKWAQGRFPGKQALYFLGPGSGNYVEVPQEQLFDFTGPFSVLVWFRFQDFPQNNADLIDNTDLISKGLSSWRIVRSFAEKEGVLTFNTNRRAQPTKDEYLIAKTRIEGERWHCVVAVCDSVAPTIKKRIYVDGALENSHEIPGTLNQNNLAVLIGDRQKGAKRTHSGWIDEVAVFRRALSAEEIAQCFREGNPYETPESSGQEPAQQRQPQGPSEKESPPKLIDS
ncbi:MAG: FecR domain-containing protein [Pirellulales bacterium]|nr:FecR domain-containing protein [Pirellulales bacterium]